MTRYETSRLNVKLERSPFTRRDLLKKETFARSQFAPFETDKPTMISRRRKQQASHMTQIKVFSADASQQIVQLSARAYSQVLFVEQVKKLFKLKRCYRRVTGDYLLLVILIIKVAFFCTPSSAISKLLVNFFDKYLLSFLGDFNVASVKLTNVLLCFGNS